MPAPPWAGWMITHVLKARTDTAGLGFEQTASGFVTDNNVLHAVPKYNSTKHISNLFQIAPCVLWLRTETQPNYHRQEERNSSL